MTSSVAGLISVVRRPDPAWRQAPSTNNWLGKFSYPDTPLVASYAYIAYTKLGEDCQFPESIVCKLGKDALNGK